MKLEEFIDSIQGQQQPEGAQWANCNWHECDNYPMGKADIAGCRRNMGHCVLTDQEWFILLIRVDLNRILKDPIKWAREHEGDKDCEWLVEAGLDEGSPDEQLLLALQEVQAYWDSGGWENELEQVKKRTRPTSEWNLPKPPAPTPEAPEVEAKQEGVERITVTESGVIIAKV